MEETAPGYGSLAYPGGTFGLGIGTVAHNLTVPLPGGAVIWQWHCGTSLSANLWFHASIKEDCTLQKVTLFYKILGDVWLVGIRNFDQE